MVRFYADERFPKRVVELLRTLGHDVLTVQETGNANQKIPDEEVLAFAVSIDRAILTLNRRHFIRLHTLQPDHAGIGCISLLRMCQKRVKMKKLVKSSNKDEVNKMTPSDQQQLKAHLKAVAKILYRNTEPTELKTFESIEKAVRQKMLSEVGPEIGSFFFQQYQELKQESPEK